MPDGLSPAPKYRHYKPKNMAVVRISGQDVYLGKYNSLQSWVRYHKEVADFLQTQLSVQDGGTPEADDTKAFLSIQHVCLAYFDFAEKYYCKNGKLTPEVHCIRAALRPLIALYGETPARRFRPRLLKRVRDEFIKAGLARVTINNHVHRIRRMFRWAGEEDLVPGSLFMQLKCVQGLRKHRAAVKESTRVLPVSDEVVQATLPYLSPPIAAMVQLQRLTGCRPGEICMMRPCDIDQSSDVWTYRPMHHKTEEHGVERRIYLGPRSQELLKPWLVRPAESHCFSPEEEVQRQRQAKRLGRKTPLGHGNRPGTNRKAVPKRLPQAHYTTPSYRRAIERACRKAKIEVWSPNQLRHTRATELRRLHGIEAAQLVLGHQEANVTEIYAEKDFGRAEAIMREIG